MIIGIGHRKHAGKSEAAKVFEECGYVRMSLADPLYRIGGIMAGWDTDPATDDQKTAFKQGYWWRTGGWERGNLVPADWQGRRLLEYMGTDILRAAYPDIWIALLQREMEKAPAGSHFVVDDIRFPNEAAWVRDQGGVLININRPILGAVDRNAHESEWALADYDEWHYTVNNSRTLGDLRADITSIAVDIGEGGV